ncbi:MAG: glycosyltransferase family 39 protein [Lachnospiraceae bacterium]|nr:glycosyltransferase family 39 protein [Lachnospiraceae bacterium]
MTLAKIKEKLNRWHFWLLGLIIFIAIVIRIIGINWGMPHNNLHPDEGLVYWPAYQCALERNFEIHDYYRPNHVTIKLNTLLYIGIQELYFVPQGELDFTSNYGENFALFTTASRIMNALFSVGIVVFAYLIALSWGKNKALFVALLFAVFPSFIEHAHYITPDTPLLFFLMGVLWAAFRYMKKPTISWLFWMSFFTALAFCEKYPGAYGCVIIATVVCVTHYKKPLLILRDGAMAILFFILGIMAVSPILLIDLRTVLEIMAGQNKQYHLGADGLNFGETIVFYATTTAVRMGFVLTVGCLYGIVRSFMKNRKPTILLISLLMYILPISKLSLHWERYTLPIYAVCLIFGAIGVFYLLDDLSRALKKNRVLAVAVYLLLLFLPVASLASSAMAVAGSFLAPDSRILLQENFTAANITKQNSVHDCNTPLDPGGYYGAFGNFVAGDPAQYKYGSCPTFVVTSSAQRDLYLEADPEIYGGVANFYKKLDEEYTMVYIHTVELPSYHFFEFQNIWFAARSVYRYLNGASVGYEIRVYQMAPS